MSARRQSRALFDSESLEQLDYFLSISPDDEPILLIDQGRHGLVSDEFVRNTEPDLIGAMQDGLPVALRDTDLDLSLLPGLPAGRQIVLRTDRRIGFDPTRPWQLTLKAVREHGSFMPSVGVRDLVFQHRSPARFYTTPAFDRPPTPQQAAILGRLQDLYLVGAFVPLLALLLWWRQDWLAGLRQYRELRLAILVGMTIFIGWYGQGQLSLVTVLGTLRGVVVVAKPRLFTVRSFFADYLVFCTAVISLLGSRFFLRLAMPLRRDARIHRIHCAKARCSAIAHP